MKTKNKSAVIVLGILLLFVTVLEGYHKMGVVEKHDNPINASNNREAEVAPQLENGPAIDVKAFGAKGDGITNDTAAIQEAINSAPALGGTIFIPPGIYLVDAVQSIRLKSGIVLQMTPDTILKAIPNSAAVYAVLAIADVRNVTVLSGVILGERKEHAGKRGEHGMGIRITGSKNVTVRGTVANDCWGDGFYIGAGNDGSPCEDIQLSDVQADNNRRQGISLITGRNIKIVRPRLTNTNGTPPAAGIDIEPNKITDILENITVVDPFTAGNEGSGISIAARKLSGTKKPISITISNHQDNGSDRGMVISGGDTIVPGSLQTENAVWLNEKRNGFAVQNHDYRSFSITVKNPKITNTNTGGSNAATTGSAIAIYHAYTNPKYLAGVIGNVSIINPVITDNRIMPKIIAAIYINDRPGKAMQNIAIIDPMIYGNLPYKIKISCTGGVQISDAYHQL